MTKQFLVDTNVVIAFLANEASVVAQFDVAQEILVSVITIGELYYGAHKSAKVSKNIAVIQDFVREVTVLNVELKTGEYYGQILYQLKAKGRPIPDNDIWIAATAIQHQLTLITRDGHFEYVDGLKFKKW